MVRSVILVVDDEEAIRLILAEALESFGYTVRQASSGEAAVEMINVMPEIDMLITDVRMPGMSGLELAEVARRVRRDLKILLISGYFVPQTVSERLLRKPFRMDELAAAVRAELG